MFLSNVLSNYMQGVITTLCIHLIAVLGISVLTGFTRLFSFGNAGFMSIGAYTSALLTLRMGFPFLLAMLCGIIFAGVVAYLLGSLTLRLQGVYFLITTLGFGESVRHLFNFLSITGGAHGLTGIPRHTNVYVALISAILAIAIAWTFIRSKYGRNLMAIREQDLAAEAVGINTFKFKRMAFVFSAMFAGWAGALLGFHMMFLSPLMFNLPRSAELTITVVIGGLGSLTGSVISSILIVILPEVLRGLAHYRMFVYGLAVILIIVLRPQGLLGYREFSITGLARWIKSLFGKTSGGKGAASK